MIIEGPFTFNPDAARAWLLDDPDGKSSYAETEGIDADWGASGHLDDSVTTDLGNLLNLNPWSNSAGDVRIGVVMQRECPVSWDDRVCLEPDQYLPEGHSRCKDLMPGAVTAPCSTRRISCRTRAWSR
jgi:hypothetical protein